MDPAEKPAKRTRVSRACDQCRIAREKCDGLQPICTTCSSSKRQCAYTANPKKRGIQPGYIRSLELALAWLFQLHPDNETQLNDRLAHEGTGSVFLSRNSKESNKLHKRWRKAQFYADVDKLLSGGEPSRHAHSEPPSPQSDDEDSDAEGHATSVSHLDAGCSSGNFREADPVLPTSWQTELPSQPLVCDSSTTLMPTDGWSLLEIYFTYTQCWLPICEKHDILKLSYSYPSQGLSLRASDAGSGLHSELWSILAVAALHDEDPLTSAIQVTSKYSRSVTFYNIARSLVPSEVGHFGVGHVRALLNLAIFDMKRSLPDAAWLLVGWASRILGVVDEAKLTADPRQKHIFAACLLLDSMLAFVSEFRHPQLHRSDMRHLGSINEDGLEEWQPWTGRTLSTEPMRTPMLALSTFNSLQELVDILRMAQETAPSSAYADNTLDLIRNWESSLPLKLGYIRSELVPTNSTPPAVLLQLTYHCALFATNPSTAGLRRLLRSFESMHKNLELKNMPPVIQCLIALVDKHVVGLALDASTRTRLQKLHLNIAGTWPGPQSTLRTEEQIDTVLPWTYDVSSLPKSANDALPATLTNTQTMHRSSARDTEAHDTSSLASTYPFDTNMSLGSLPIAPGPSQPDPRHPELTSDLESFFDDLASLDNTANLNTQPQFMQNLGFAPNASMADLFSEYIPMQSSTFLMQDDAVPSNFDQYSLYNAG